MGFLAFLGVGDRLLELCCGRNGFPDGFGKCKFFGDGFLGLGVKGEI